MKIFILILIVFSPICNIFSQTSFNTTWKTDNPGPSDNFSIALPLAAESYYDFEVNWGDNSSDEFMGFGADLIASHTYSSAGTYTVSIEGVFPRIFFNFSGDRQKLLAVENWGEIAWQSFESAFYGCLNLNTTASDTPDLTNVTSLRRMFTFASSFNQSIENWDVSNVVDMSNMFTSANSFNQSIATWDVSNVTNMNGMFSSATAFNQSIEPWNVSNVITMNSMFLDASSFNQPLDNWDVSNITDLSSMFSGAAQFNQPLNFWSVSNVQSMAQMFTYASNFNMPLDNWDVSNVTNMASMFHHASSFNRNIETWNVSNVTNMSQMFQHASSFNEPLNAWDVSNVNEMISMFSNATSFNQPLNNWNISGLNGTQPIIQMFSYAESFNQPLNNWDVSGITNMRNLFRGALAFNQPLDNWDVSNVSDMLRMFEGATAYDQSLGNWDLSSVWNMTHMLSNSGMSYCSYDQTLQGWAAQTPNFNQTLGATGLQYTAMGAPARFQLVDTYQWTITGDALTVPVALEITSTVNGPEISVLANGGSGNYTYNWNGPYGFESTDSDIVAPVNGSYTVIVSDGCETWTETFEILTVGISKSETEIFQLFPNPTTGLIYGFSNSLDYNKIQVFDLNGKQVFESDFTSNVISFNLSHLESGFYLGRLMDKNGVAHGVQRICVIR